MGNPAYKYNFQNEIKELETVIHTNSVDIQNQGYGSLRVVHSAKNKGNKINRILSVAMIVLTCITFTSYSFVSESEKKLNKLGKEIVYYTNENMDLQNKLDNLNSFRRVERVIKENTTLDTAQHIMEIPALQIADAAKSVYIPQIHNWVIGY